MKRTVAGIGYFEKDANVSGIGISRIWPPDGHPWSGGIRYRNRAALSGSCTALWVNCAIGRSLPRMGRCPGLGAKRKCSRRCCVSKLYV